MNIKKFLSILQIELEEIENELADLIEADHVKERNHLITEYVSRENDSLFMQEIQALKQFVDELASFPSDELMTLDDTEKKILDFFSNQIEKRDYPRALWFALERKVHKVRKYVET